MPKSFSIDRVSNTGVTARQVYQTDILTRQTTETANNLDSPLLGYYRVIPIIIVVTIQLTTDLPDSGAKSAHIHLYTARFFLVLEQIRGNLNSYQ